MSRPYLLALAATSLLAGCTVTSTPGPTLGSSGSTAFPSSDSYNYLFDAPRSTPTPDQVNGIWNGESADANTTLRFELKANELIIGARCGDTTIGNEDPAVFTNEEMQTQKSLFVASNNNGKTCGVNFPKLDVKKCDATDPCFTLAGTTLTLKSKGEKDVVLTKISD